MVLCTVASISTPSALAMCMPTRMPRHSILSCSRPPCTRATVGNHFFCHPSTYPTLATQSLWLHTARDLLIITWRATGMCIACSYAGVPLFQQRPMISEMVWRVVVAFHIMHIMPWCDRPISWAPGAPFILYNSCSSSCFCLWLAVWWSPPSPASCDSSKLLLTPCVCASP
jgi:hypothetical protein